MSWHLFWTILAAVVAFWLFWVAIDQLEKRPSPPRPAWLPTALRILLCVVTAIVIAVRFGLLHG